MHLNYGMNLLKDAQKVLNQSITNEYRQLKHHDEPPRAYSMSLSDAAHMHSVCACVHACVCVCVWCVFVFMCMSCACVTGADYGDLDGVTFAVKDNLCVKGMTTTCASKFLKGWWHTPRLDVQLF